MEKTTNYYHGRACLDNIEHFYAHHQGLSCDEGFYIGNIIKYLWRYKLKNGIDDLKKARKYMDLLIEENEHLALLKLGEINAD